MLAATAEPMKVAGCTRLESGVLAKARQSLGWSRSQAEVALLSNYDQRIDAALAFFRDRFEELRVKKIDTQKRTGDRNLVKDTQEVVVYSNAAALQDALAYCRNAIQEIEGMKLVADLDVDRIEALRKGIPDADALTKYSTKKDLDTTDGPGPGPGLLSSIRRATDNLSDMAVGALMEWGKIILAPKRRQARPWRA